MTQMTNAGLSAAFAEQSDEVWLVYLTIDHDDMTDSPLYLVRNSEDVDRTIDAVTVTFSAVMFDITLPADLEKEISGASITVPNVDRSITDKMRELIGKKPAVVTIEVSTATEPDVMQFGPFEMDLNNIHWSAASVKGTLSPSTFLNQSWPKERFDNARFPGLYPG